jgi:hypothetical protein
MPPSSSTTSVAMCWRRPRMRSATSLGVGGCGWVWVGEWVGEWVDKWVGGWVLTGPGAQGSPSTGVREALQVIQLINV